MKEITADSSLALVAALATNPRTAALIALLVVAAVIDARTFRIPNWLTLGGLAFGLIYNAAVPAPDAPGLGWAALGAALGLVLLLPLYMLRVLGAGDVKLMAMVGAFLGFPAILYTVLFTFIAGGIAAVAFALTHRASRRMAANVGEIARSMAFAAMTGARPAAPAPGTSIGKLPYGISIALGSIAYVVARQMA